MILSSRRLKPIGIFDSGIGGLSILAEARRLMPNESFVYYGDFANAPYGDKTLEEIKQITLSVAHELSNIGIKSLVVACNTATSAAIKDLRQEYDFPVIGTEPALKPAMMSGGTGQVLVMATTATLHLDKYKQLMEKFGIKDRVIELPCIGLSTIIEENASGSKQIEEYLRQLFYGINPKDVESVVLGCTHYGLIADDIRMQFPSSKIYDTNKGVSKRLKQLLTENNLTSPAKTGSLDIKCSGDFKKHKLINKILAGMEVNI